MIGAAVFMLRRKAPLFNSYAYFMGLGVSTAAELDGPLSWNLLYYLHTIFLPRASVIDLYPTLFVVARIFKRQVF